MRYRSISALPRWECSALRRPSHVLVDGPEKNISAKGSIRTYRRDNQRGVTLLELMIVVAIAGILAAVVIPNWTTSARNGRYDPEITAMFAEIATRQEQYKSEVGNGLYLAAAACPTAPNPNGINFNTVCVTTASPWAALRVNPTDSSIRCTYSIAAGAPGTLTAVPMGCPAAPPALAGSWYLVIATCDMNGNGGTNATFCTTSWNNQQTRMNYGS